MFPWKLQENNRNEVSNQRPRERPALETVVAMPDDGGYSPSTRHTETSAKNRTDGGDVALTHAGEGR